MSTTVKYTLLAQNEVDEKHINGTATEYEDTKHTTKIEDVMDIPVLYKSPNNLTDERAFNKEMSEEKNSIENNKEFLMQVCSAVDGTCENKSKEKEKWKKDVVMEKIFLQVWRSTKVSPKFANIYEDFLLSV